MIWLLWCCISAESFGSICIFNPVVIFSHTKMIQDRSLYRLTHCSSFIKKKKKVPIN